MRAGAGLALMIGMAGMAQAAAAPISMGEAARAMQGCWNQTGPLNALVGESGITVSDQLCLKGGVEGVVTELGCSTHDDLTECSTSDGTYAFHDTKFWQDFEGVRSSCDVLLEGRNKLTLRNCLWIEPPPALEPIEDAVYDKAAS